MTTIRNIVVAAVLTAGAAGLAGCGAVHTDTATSRPDVSTDQPQNDLRGIQTTLDNIDKEIAGDPPIVVQDR